MDDESFHSIRPSCGAFMDSVEGCFAGEQDEGFIAEMRAGQIRDLTDRPLGDGCNIFHQYPDLEWMINLKTWPFGIRNGRF
jgi:hypothetical protein